MRYVALFVLGSALATACSSTDDGTMPRTSQVDDTDAGDGTSATDGGTTPAKDSGAVPPPPQDAGPSYTGEATYYAADGTGACGFAATPNDLMVAAMNKSQYAKSICGKCVSVTGPNGTVKVRIVDLCPGCAMGDLDLSEQAFAKIAKLSAGRVKITWSYVAC